MDNQLLSPYIPIDRRQALAKGNPLPDRTHGAALFADVSGFTPLTEAYLRTLGHRRGADELTKQLNLVYDTLIRQVHGYHGSVINFAGDAITCWFDQDDGRRATACGLAMQHVMAQFAQVDAHDGSTVCLTVKVAIASGPVRRFLVGDPDIHYLDVLAGTTLEQMAQAEKLAQKSEVILSPATTDRLHCCLRVAEWRQDSESGAAPCAVVTALTASPMPQFVRQASTDLPPLTDQEICPWLLPPIYERLQSGPDKFLAEIRPVAVLFLKFAGLDYDADETAQQKLDAFIQWVQQILLEHESYVMQLLVGDKGSYLYTIFGAPVAHDDDSWRAVAAALALQTVPAELSFIKNIQIGISQGRVRTGAYGGLRRLTYGVLGDGVNLAARLMSQAAPGQIMVSQNVVEVTAQDYYFKYLGPVKVKGKQDLIPVSLAVGTRLPSVQRAFTGFNVPLIGRDAQLQQLLQLLQATLSGQEQIILIEGATGIGKSHLVAEFASQAIMQGVQVLVGACQVTTRYTIYAPWRQIFQDLFKLPQITPHTFSETDTAQERQQKQQERFRQQIVHLEKSLTEMNPKWLIRLPLLGDLLDLPIPDTPTTATFDSKLRQDSLFDLAEQLLKWWAKRQPLLILLEDIHWLDEGSRELLISLTRLQKKVPILFTLIQRPGMSEQQTLLTELKRLPHYHYLYLAELAPPGVDELVCHLLQGETDPLLLSLIQAQGHGNPFFTQELVNALHDSGHIQRQSDGRWAVSDSLFDTLYQANCLVRHNGSWQLAEQAPLSTVDLGIPNSIHSLILSRFDRLPEASKVTLKVASVIGRVFEFDLLTQAHPSHLAPTIIRHHTDTLQKRDFILSESSQSDLVYIFRHNITQQVTYETLLEQQEQILHQAIGEALERLYPEATERLAFHFRHSGQRDKAMFYLDRAALKARHDHANETALRYYNQALQFEERWLWRKGQVEVLHILGWRDEEQASLNILAGNTDMPPLALAYLWGQYYEATGEYDQAQQVIETTLNDQTGQTEPVAQAQCHALLGLVAYRQGDYETAKKCYHQALDLLELPGIPPEEGLPVVALGLNGLGTVHRQQGNFEKAVMYYEDALAISHDNGDLPNEAQALNNLGVLAHYQRNFSQALVYHQQALEIRQTIGHRPGEGASLSNLAQISGDTGNYGQSAKYLYEALTILQATGNRWEEITVWNDLGINYQELGDLIEAQNCLQRGIALAHEIGDKEGVAYLSSNLGLVLRDQRDFSQAEAVLLEGLAFMEAAGNDFQISLFLTYLSTVSLQAGDLESAIVRAKQSLTLRQQLALQFNLADTLALLAAIYLAKQAPHQALQYAEQALTILDECQGEGPEFPQQDYFICYQALLQNGQAERADQALQIAHQLVMERANKITDAVLRESFLENVAVNRQIRAAWKSS